MEDIELHDATHVKTIIDRGGRCNASKSDVTRMASLSQTRVNSNYALNFHVDAYNMEAGMIDFHYFCVCFGTKLKLMQKPNIGNAIISSVIGAVGRKLSIEKFVSYPIKRHFVYTEEEVLVPMMCLISERGGKQIHVKRINSMLYVWSGLGSRGVPTHHYRLMDLMYLTLIQITG